MNEQRDELNVLPASSARPPAPFFPPLTQGEDTPSLRNEVVTSGVAGTMSLKTQVFGVGLKSGREWGPLGTGLGKGSERRKNTQTPLISIAQKCHSAWSERALSNLLLSESSRHKTHCCPYLQKPVIPDLSGFLSSALRGFWNVPHFVKIGGQCLRKSSHTIALGNAYIPGPPEQLKAARSPTEPLHTGQGSFPTPAGQWAAGFLPAGTAIQGRSQCRAWFQTLESFPPRRGGGL